MTYENPGSTDELLQIYGTSTPISVQTYDGSGSEQVSLGDFLGEDGIDACPVPHLNSMTSEEKVGYVAHRLAAADQLRPEHSHVLSWWTSGKR